MSRRSCECFESDDELEKMPKSKGKTSTSIVGPFSTWWHRWVEPEALELFTHDNIAYAVRFSEGYNYPWGLDFAGKGRNGIWGGGGQVYKSREELEEYITRKELRPEVQLTLDL